MSIQICNAGDGYGKSLVGVLLCSAQPAQLDMTALHRGGRIITRVESERNCCFYPEGGGEAGLWSQGEDVGLQLSCQGCTQGIFQWGDQVGLIG